MHPPLKKFRGAFKPPGQPRIDFSLAPRGLILSLAPSDNVFYANHAQGISTFPGNRGSTVKYGPNAFGAGAQFSSVTGATNSVGFSSAAAFPTPNSLEALLVTGPSVTSEHLFGCNNNVAGTGTGDHAVFFNSSSQLSATAFDGNSRTAVDTVNTYQPRTLYHIVVTWDSSNQTIYVNGVQVAQSIFLGSSFSQNFVFGANSVSGPGALASGCTILLYNVYREVLTVEEIQQRALDPFSFLIFPEDEIFSTIVGATGGGPVTQNITLTGIASTNAFGTMSLDMNVVLSGIPSAAALGTMKVGMNIALTGIANVNHFGVMSLGMNISLTGIASTAAVGSPSLVPLIGQNIQLAGITPTSGVGSPSVRDPEAASLFGIPSTISFGQLSVTQQAVPTNSLIDTNIPYEWVDSSENFQLYLYLASVMNTIRVKDEAVIFVTGDPTGVVSAKPGTIALNKSGGAGNTVWSKESGLGNTGWVNIG